MVTMSNREDRTLANVIKTTHAELRHKTVDSNTDPLDVWKQHVDLITHMDKGKDYSEAMKCLSDVHWTEATRIKWIRDKLELYFMKGDKSRFLTRLLKKSGLEQQEVEQDQLQVVHVLDVGACHNPLAKGAPDWLKVTAMDLCPADSSVLQGDFLSVPILNETIKDDDKVSLMTNSFDAVIFCLMLEYLPVPHLRHQAVQRAKHVLKQDGLLIIVTPDSSHEAKNLDQMRAWRLALANLGLLRIYTDKLKHVRCLAYVKVDRDLFRCQCDKQVAEMCDKLNLKQVDDYAGLMTIPQDKNVEKRTKTQHNNKVYHGDVDTLFLNDFQLLTTDDF